MFTPPILPPAGTPQPAPVSGTPGSVLVNVPPILRSLPLNALLQTTYTGTDTRGNAWLTTPQGKVQLSGQLPLNPGTMLALQVVQSGDHLVLKLLSVNGMPVQTPTNAVASSPATNTSPNTPPAPGAPLPTSSPATTTVLSLPLVFRSAPPATPAVITPTAPATPTPTSNVPLPSLTPGTVLQTVLTTPQLPALQTLFQQTIQSETRPQLSSIIRRDGIPQFGVPVEQLAASVTPGSTVTVRVNASGMQSAAPITAGTTPAVSPEPEAPLSLFASADAEEPELLLPLPPQTPPTTANRAVPLPPQSIEAYRQLAAEGAPSLPLTGTVQGKDPQGVTIIQTPIGTLKVTLAANSGMERGMPVEFDILNIQLPTNVPITAATPALAQPASPPLKNVTPALVQLFTHWRSLEQLSDVIIQAAQDHPEAADVALRKFLPAADGNLAGKLLHFMQALRAGDAQKWLGETLVKYLEQSGQQELLQAIKQDFQTLRTLWSDTTAQPGQWQTLAFPVYDGEQLRMARMFVRDYPEESGNGAAAKKRKGKATRFIVEVDLSQLGDMQLDGLVQPGAESAQFDLVIRTRRPLPAEMQTDIMELFTSASAITGMDGSVQFSVHREFPVLPVQELLRQHRNDFTV